MSHPAPPSARHRSPNTVLWLTFAATAVVVGAFFVFQVHRRVSVDALLGLLALLSRTAIFVVLGLFLEALLLRTAGGYLTETRTRRTAIHGSAGALVLLCVALVVDFFVFAFAGYHLDTAAKILFSDGPEGVVRVVDAAGLSLSVVIGSAVGLAVALLGAVVISKLTRRLSARRPVEVSRKASLLGLTVAFSALAVIDAVGYRVRNPFLWEREMRTVPLAFALARPPAELASFTVSVKRPDVSRSRAQVAALAPINDKPDVFIVVVESLRRDIITPEIMPRFAAFSKEAMTFEHAQTTGNVTHYSWYGLLCGGYPLFFDGIKKLPEEQGSVPLLALRKLGYRTRLFATPDTAYQNLDAVVFGPRAALLDEKFHPPGALAAERDRAVVAEVSRVLATEKPGGTVNVIALDSTHFDYVWGAGFQPPFLPYATDASISRNYAKDAKARAALFNRYKSSAAWMDQLLGQLFDALQKSGRMENSIVVVTGDHGEAFWEHGSGSHGSDLGREQIDVGFAMRLPGRAPKRFDAVFSLMDVMPTILSHVGVDSSAMLPGVALQRRVNAADGSLSPRAALTFQGWNLSAFRFALTHGDRRLLFELDAANPLEAKKIVLKDITDLDSVSQVSGDKSTIPLAYQRVLRDLPQILDAMPFLQL